MNLPGEKTAVENSFCCTRSKKWSWNLAPARRTRCGPPWEVPKGWTRAWTRFERGAQIGTHLVVIAAAAINPVEDRHPPFASQGSSFLRLRPGPVALRGGPEKPGLPRWWFS